MEPPDVLRNDEKGRRSNRRISSILKAPRTSLKNTVLEKEECEIEVARPVEKRRISRRVSFAASDNVLLFSKEVKNGSPVHSPLQNLSNATSQSQDQPRVQMITEDKPQSIAGMETLLNAPLHGCQRTMENDLLNQENYGENTMMFTGDESAYMDVTHCHTILIANHFELPALLPNEKIPVEKSSALSLAPPKKLSSNHKSEFQGFLATMSKQSSPRNNKLSASSPAKNLDTHSFLARLKAPVSGIDKENHIPVPSTRRAFSGMLQNQGTEPDDIDLERFQPPVMDDHKTFQIKNSVEQMFMESTTNQFSLTQESDDMDFTRSQTVHIEAKHLNFSRSVEKQNDLSLKPASNKSCEILEDECNMEMTKSLTVSIDHMSQFGGPKSEEQLFMESTTNQLSLTQESDDMDLTRSQTVHIEAKHLHFSRSVEKENGLSLKPASNKSCDILEDECNMEMTKSLTVSIDHMSQFGGPRMPQTPFNSSGCKTDNFNRSVEKQKGLSLMPASKSCGILEEECNMEMTKSLTVSIDHMSQFGVPNSEEQLFMESTTNQFSLTQKSDDMDLTRSQTVNIEAKHLNFSRSVEKQNGLSLKPASNKACEILEDECNMEMTKSLTVSIDHMSQFGGPRMPQTPFDSSGCKTDNFNRSVEKQNGLSLMPASNKSCGILEEHCNMEMTKSLTVSIDHMSQFGGPNSEEQLFMESTTNQLSLTQESDDMDLTRSQTVNIEAKHLNFSRSVEKQNGLSLKPASNKACDILEEECNMEMTKSLTVSIDHMSQFGGPRIPQTPFDSSGCKTDHLNLSVEKQKGLSLMPASNKSCGILEECNMEMTKSLTVSIDHMSQFGGLSMPQTPFDSSGFKTSNPIKTSSSVRADTLLNDMEITRGHTVAIDYKNYGCINPSYKACNQRTVDTIDTNKTLILENDNGMENTRALTTSTQGDISLSTKREEIMSTKNVFPPSDERSHVNKTLSLGSRGFHSTAVAAPVFYDMELTRRRSIEIKPNREVAHLDVEETSQFTGGEIEQEALGSLEKVEYNGTLFGKTSPLISTTVMSENHDIEIDNQQMSTPTSHRTSSLLPSSKVLTNSITDRFNPNERANKNDCELRKEGGLLLDKPEPETSPAIAEVEELSSKNATARQKSLADLQSKLQHMSQLTNEPTENQWFPVLDGEYKSMTKVDHTFRQDNALEERTFGTTPLTFNSKCLTSRLSLGVIKPKLPQRTKAVEKNHQIDEYIADEVLPDISYEEDRSETDALQRINENEAYFQSVQNEMAVDDDGYKKLVNVTQGRKRAFPENQHEDCTQDEKRKNTSSDNLEDLKPASPIIQWDSNVNVSVENAQSLIPKIIDGSNSGNSTNLQGEMTYESMCRQSQFESQLDKSDDYTCDMRKKLEDGSITVAEFLKLFGINLFIHRSRQSILPAKLASDLEHSTKDWLISNHINRPKQRVYEMDCQKLTEILEGFKARMSDQDNPLKSVNRGLWETVTSLSNKELKGFGAKLKERASFFSKRSKVQSHEIKEVLYSNLLSTSKEEHQNLTRIGDEMDEMLKDLDDCILGIEAELNAVEGKGLGDNQPTLKSRQQELQEVCMMVTDKERQVCELNIQKIHSMEQLNVLRDESRGCEDQIAVLQRINEWKLGERKDNKMEYSFLHGTVLLNVVFEKLDGEDVYGQTERIISSISFQQKLDDEKSKCHARLVHKLLSEYTDSGKPWITKYPTSQYVPKLLQDVGLVVGRCRLLGEEVHMMKRWGALRLDILDISCLETGVRILFSSLKALAKFELTIAVSHTYPFCLLKVQDFKNYIGLTTIHQVEEIVFSVAPAKNYLTKIVTSIHDTLL